MGGLLPTAQYCHKLDENQCNKSHRRLEVEGNAFLYKQVRHMTGALLAVGAGQLPPEAITAALAAGGAPRAGAFRGWMVAEAKGLCLQEVVYAPACPLPGL